MSGAVDVVIAVGVSAGSGLFVAMGAGSGCSIVGSSIVVVGTSVIGSVDVVSVISRVLDVPTSGSSTGSVEVGVSSSTTGSVDVGISMMGSVVVGVSMIGSGSGDASGSVHASQKPGVARSLMSGSRFIEDVALCQRLSAVRIIDILFGSDEPAGGALPSPAESISVPSDVRSSIFNALLESEIAVVTICTEVALMDFSSSWA